MPATFGRAHAMTTMMAAALVCAILWTMRVADSARILAVEPVGGKSHWNFMSGVIHALLDRGHHVTAFTPFADGAANHGGNYTEVDLSDAVPKLQDADLGELMRNWGNPFGLAGQFVEMSRQLCDGIYENPEMKRLLRRQGDASAGVSSDDFDAVLIEPFLSECLTYAAARLHVPLIYALPIPVVGLTERLSTGHFSNPAAVSHSLARHALPKTFVQRLTNTALFVYFEVVRAYRDPLLRFTDPKPFDSIVPVSPSLVFVNGHFVSNAPSPTSADVINVGGIHLKPAANTLPEDILKFIEQSPHGIIYFSFGSTVKMSTLPEHLKKAFIGVLSQVPQRVLLKYEEDMEDKPKNMMTVKWLPQREILLHPNVKLFISHGGISGLYEAVDAGVPVLGFPLFIDQHRNIDNLVNAGMAISMDILTVTKETFLNNVTKILNDEKYTTNAKIASEIFKDRPLSPAEQVVYWTEYVIRNKGAPHLKSHAVNLTWYQYYLLDVILFVLMFSCIVLFITLICLKAIIKCVLHFLRKVKVKSE